MNNKQKFAETYAQAFTDSYPELPADRSKHLIANAVKVLTEQSIRRVIIDSPAFKLTCKRLAIKCTYKAIEEFLTEKEAV